MIEPVTLYGRESEHECLVECLRDPHRSHFVAIHGRRRVGKTELLNTLLPLASFHVVAENIRIGKSVRDPLKKQLQGFERAMQHWGLHVERTPFSWSEAFFMLARALDAAPNAAAGGKIILLMDEMPWFDVKRSGFVEALAHFWNSWAQQKKRVLLAVAGSASWWILQHILSARGGLHGRVTRQLHLRPFTLGQTRRFFEREGHSLTNDQVLRLHMALGGVPGHLVDVRRGWSAADAIDRLCFDPQSTARLRHEEALQAMFDHYERHAAILRALSHRKDAGGWTRDAISAACRIPSGSALSRTLAELEACDMIASSPAFGKDKNGRIYWLADAYSGFYLHWIEGGSPQAGDWRRLQTDARFHAWAGLAFENICLAHLPQIKQALGISGAQCSAHAWQCRADESTPGAQVDLLLDTSDCAYLCEMKYPSSQSIRQHQITHGAAQAFKLKSSIFRLRSGISPKKAVKHVFITPEGVFKNSHALEIVDLEIRASHLFA